MTRPGEGCLHGLLLALAFTASRPALAETQVAKAFRLHMSQDELKQVANAFGEEISRAPFTGTYDGTASDDLGFATVSAENITYTASVQRVDSLIRNPAAASPKGALATKVVLDSLVINIGTLTLNESGTVRCHNLKIRSMLPVNLAMNLRPSVENHVLQMNPADMSFDRSGNHFQPAGPAACDAPWGLSWLTRQIAPWIAGKLQEPLAAAVTDSIGMEIRRLTEFAGSAADLHFALPWQTMQALSVSGSHQLRPASAALHHQGPSREHALTVDFDAEVTAGPDGEENLPAAHTERFTSPGDRPVTWNGWIGTSKDLVAAVLSQGVLDGSFNVTLNKQSAPSLGRWLTARELARFIPDAATRFQGDEDVEVRVSEAAAVSVIFKPNGPGGIPIIDAVLEKVPVEVKVAGVPYFTTKSTMRFTYQPATDAAGGRIVFRFSESAYSVERVRWNPDLIPGLTNRTVGGSGFSAWFAGFAVGTDAKEARAFAVALPVIQIGSYSVRWLDAISVRDGYLAIAAAVR